MGMFVNPDNSAFQVALNSEIYVDKTGMLEYTNKVINTLQGYICNSRPRRFGKSVTANMLAAYYSKGCDSREMFSTLKISESIGFEKNINKYDVIHIDIQWCIEPAGGSENVVSYITEKTICELREYYPNELSEKIKSLPEALSVINSMNGTKFIIIIDEWDIIIRDEANNKKVQEEYINFLRAMFKGTEPTKYIQLAYLTGILPVKKEKTQSALNNFKDYSMLHAGPIAPYVGFTETEVQKLCEVYGSFTDICEIAPVVGCAAVNLSIGYYKAHTTSEYTVLSEMERSIQEACKILERTTENDKFNYVESYCSAAADWIDDMYDDYYGSKYYVVEYVDKNNIMCWYDTIAHSKAEAVGKFVMECPDIPFENVIDVMVDSNVYNYI